MKLKPVFSAGTHIKYRWKTSVKLFPIRLSLPDRSRCSLRFLRRKVYSTRWTRMLLTFAGYGRNVRGYWVRTENLSRVRGKYFE